MSNPADAEFWAGLTPEALTEYISGLKISSGSGHSLFYVDTDWDKTSPKLSNVGFTMKDGSEAHSFLSSYHGQISTVLQGSTTTFDEICSH